MITKRHEETFDDERYNHFNYDEVSHVYTYVKTYYITCQLHLKNVVKATRKYSSLHIRLLICNIHDNA